MVERYEDIDLNFGGSREHSLLKVGLLLAGITSFCLLRIEQGVGPASSQLDAHVTREGMP